MSKIQKALRALSDSRKQAASAVSDHREDKQTTRGAPSPSVRTVEPAAIGQSVHTKSLVDLGAEPTPAHRIDIQTKDIVAAGLFPSTEDLEIIGQQFRRIKRPIIQTAFGSDLPVGKNSNVIMMASALPGAGKSFCGFNLAQSIALERDIGAILVDADVLKPGISRSLGLDEHIGLIDYLLDTSIQLEEILVQTNLNDVVIVPAGRKHAEATELLASRRMQDLVSILADRYASRAVVFDTPPLLLTNEAQVLAAQMGQIVMVIEARVSTQDSVSRALSLLDRQMPINAILNKSRSAAGSDYQGNEYGSYVYPDSSS